MRTFPDSPIAAAGATTTATAKATFSPPETIHRSPWHSPVPYLFGGLAAMLGLIAFALLVLACSYWRNSNAAGDNAGNQNGDGDAEKGESGGHAKAAPVFEEKFLVIMAGDMKPTFLATPISKNSSFNEESESKDENSQNNKAKDETNDE